MSVGLIVAVRPYGTSAGLVNGLRRLVGGVGVIRSALGPFRRTMIPFRNSTSNLQIRKVRH